MTKWDRKIRFFCPTFDYNSAALTHKLQRPVQIISHPVNIISLTVRHEGQCRTAFTDL